MQADPVIYDNNARPGAWFIGSQVWSDGHSQAADDFILPGGGPGWRVTDVHWSGFDFFNGAITSFRFIFYADDGGMPTGDGTADPTSTAIAVREATAGVADLGGGVFDYWADIDPVALSGGTQYWIAIQALVDTDSSE